MVDFSREIIVHYLDVQKRYNMSFFSLRCELDVVVDGIDVGLHLINPVSWYRRKDIIHISLPEYRGDQ